MLIDNPESTGKGLAQEQRNNGQEQVQYCWLVLARGTENDDALVITRRITPDVAEPEVERDEASPLPLNDRAEFRIGRIRQLFLVDRVRIVTSIAQRIRDFHGQILIDLEAQGLAAFAR